MLKRAQKPTAEIPMPEADIPMPKADIPAPAAPAAPAPVSAKPASPSPAPVGIASPITPSSLPDAPAAGALFQQGTVPIKTMQQEMINFANILVHILDDTMNRPQSINEGIGRKTDKKFFEKLFFNNLSSSQKDKKKSYENIINEITNIGSANKPSTPDGIWGDKTNQGLRNIYDTAIAITKIQSDMGTPTTKYETELKQFGELIPAEHAKLHINQKIDLATKITLQLKKMAELVNEFKTEFLDKNKDLLNQNKSMIDFRSIKTLNEQEKKFLQTYNKEVISTLNKVDITLGDLEHPNKLNEKLKAAGIDITDVAKVKEAINKIKATVNTAVTPVPVSPQPESI